MSTGAPVRSKFASNWSSSGQGDIYPAMLWKPGAPPGSPGCQPLAHRVLHHQTWAPGEWEKLFGFWGSCLPPCTPALGNCLLPNPCSKVGAGSETLSLCPGSSSVLAPAPRMEPAPVAACCQGRGQYPSPGSDLWIRAGAEKQASAWGRGQFFCHLLLELTRTNLLLVSYVIVCYCALGNV